MLLGTLLMSVETHTTSTTGSTETYTGSTDDRYYSTTSATVIDYLDDLVSGLVENIEASIRLVVSTIVKVAITIIAQYLNLLKGWLAVADGELTRSLDASPFRSSELQEGLSLMAENLQRAELQEQLGETITAQLSAHLRSGVQRLLSAARTYSAA